MAKSLQSLAEKLEKLASQRDEARALLKEAREEIADLHYRLAMKEEELKKANLDVRYLSVSHKLAENPQALADARATVKGMLARVDKAIALLKDDARI